MDFRSQGRPRNTLHDSFLIVPKDRERLEVAYRKALVKLSVYRRSDLLFRREGRSEKTKSEFKFLRKLEGRGIPAEAIRKSKGLLKEGTWRDSTNDQWWSGTVGRARLKERRSKWDG